MLMSELVSETRKEASQSDPSVNAQLLIRAGYVNRLMAGAYSFLPLGKRVLDRIETIVRQEMDAVGGQEILMPCLHPKENWVQSGRYESMDVLYKLEGQGGNEFVLGASEEEVVTPLVASFVKSYRDLPVAVYQVGTKFRNELRAKSGILRGREFRMKDMYSFHASEADMDQFYERVTEAYKRVFQRCGLGDVTLYTYASGGAFSKYSHEFQALTPYGEDTLYRIPGTMTAINKEIIEDQEALASIIPNYTTGDEAKLEVVKGIEVGNIFKLGARFTDSFGMSYSDKEGQVQHGVLNGCYGIGTTRLMGAIVECLSDERGLVWPRQVSPFDIHLTSLARSDEDIRQADAIYAELKNHGLTVLYDDRRDLAAGSKLADADLIGIPFRVVVSAKTIAEGKVELKARSGGEAALVKMAELKQRLI